MQSDITSSNKPHLWPSISEQNGGQGCAVSTPAIQMHSLFGRATQWNRTKGWTPPCTYTCVFVCVLHCLHWARSVITACVSFSCMQCKPAMGEERAGPSNTVSKSKYSRCWGRQQRWCHRTAGDAASLLSFAETKRQTLLLLGGDYKAARGDVKDPRGQMFPESFYRCH